MVALTSGRGFVNGMVILFVLIIGSAKTQSKISSQCYSIANCPRITEQMQNLLNLLVQPPAKHKLAGDFLTGYGFPSVRK